MGNTPTMRRLRKKLKIKNKKNKLPNLLAKLHHLKEESSSVKDLAIDYEMEFRVAVYDYCLENRISPKGFSSVGSSNDDPDFKPSTEVSQNIKNIYRKIASMTHPDKLPGGIDESLKKSLVSNFMKATESIKNGFIYDILKIAEKLDITVDELELAELTSLHEEIAFLEKEIAYNKNTYSWKWGVTRDAIWIKKYLNS